MPHAGMIDAKTFPPAALRLILEAEGLDQPSKWPEGASGITIGHGDDLGYQSAAEFLDNWGAVLDHAVSVRLLDAIGFKGEHAHAIAYEFVHQLYWLALMRIVPWTLLAFLLVAVIRWGAERLAQSAPLRWRERRTSATLPANVATVVATAPSCPACQRAMVQRAAKRGAHTGLPFWGCPGYPGCRGTRELV